jgi:hypothetical protein
VIYISGRVSPDVKWEAVRAYNDPSIVNERGMEAGMACVNPEFFMDVKWEVVTTCTNLLFSCVQVDA